jgi:hypothetical protein
MSGGRRHNGWKGVRQRDVRRAESKAVSSRAVRWDVVTRHAIMRGVGLNAVVWWCPQSSGWPKPGYRTREVAAKVADLLWQHGGTRRLEPYLCRRTDQRAIPGEHWHLFTPEKRLTPPDEGRIVSGVEAPTSKDTA